MKTNFSILSHNEPEIFRLLDQLHGQRVFVVDDFSAIEYLEKVSNHSSRPIVMRRALNKDFASQRNYVHNFIPEGEWVITIDADETFDSFEMFTNELDRVTTEAFRIARRNVIVYPDGIETVLDETHIRGFHNHPDRIMWKNEIHELPTGFNDYTMIDGAKVMHVKTAERCAKQHEFYCSFNP